jgi:hypothetical protein
MLKAMRFAINAPESQGLMTSTEKAVEGFLGLYQNKGRGFLLRGENV